MELFILSSNSWPVNKVITGNFPVLLSNQHEDIENAYKQKNQGKVLKYHLPYCSAEIEFKIGSKVNSYLIIFYFIKYRLLYSRQMVSKP